jgi:hypothetical protein
MTHKRVGQLAGRVTRLTDAAHPVQPGSRSAGCCTIRAQKEVDPCVVLLPRRLVTKGAETQLADLRLRGVPLRRLAPVAVTAACTDTDPARDSWHRPEGAELRDRVVV